MAERAESIAKDAEPTEAGRPAGAGGPRVVAVRSAAARSTRRRAGGGGAGKKAAGSGGKAGAKGRARKRAGGGAGARRRTGNVRSASTSSSRKAAKGGAKKAAKKGAKSGRKTPTKKAGSRPVGKKTAAKKPPTKKSPAKAARKAAGKKPEKRAGTHKPPKTARKAAAGVGKKPRPAKAARKAPAKKPAKRAPAKKALKAARKAVKHTPARTPHKAAPVKGVPARSGEAGPERAPRRAPVEPGLSAPAAAGTGPVAAGSRAEPGRRRKAEPPPPVAEGSAAGAGTAARGESEGAEAAGPPVPAGRRARGESTPRKRRKPARFDAEPEVRKKKRARLEKMRRAGVFGVPGARPRRLRKRKMRDEMVRPSPPLEKTDPLKHYLAGEMVPCPVGCGGFSEVVRVSTMDSGAGEIWFECLSCAQRKMFEIPAATVAEQKAIFAELEAGHEPLCPRHSKLVPLRRRGRDFVCPECGVRFAEP